MILVELTAAVDEFETLETFRVGTHGWQTAPGDVPADAVFDARLREAGAIGLSAFADGRTGGATRLETGEMKIANVDGALDGWKNYAFDGRPVWIRWGRGGAYPGAFATVFAGVAESVQVTLEDVIVRLRDKAAILDRPVLTETYAGTNEGPVGLEGTEADIKGRQKPWVLGRPDYLAPPMVNASKLAFQASKRPLAAIRGVYIRGVAQDFGTDHANSADLMAATVGAGEYDTCLAEGLFRLGSMPDGEVACDATEQAADEQMTAGQILARLAAEAGLTADEIDAHDIGELNAAAPYVLGLFLDDATTFRAAMDMVANSVGAWYAFDARGVLRCGRLAEPAGAADTDIVPSEVLEQGFQRREADGDGVPAWRVELLWGRLWAGPEPNVPASVDAERRAELSQAWRTAAAEDPAVRLQFRQAKTLSVETLLTDAADAAAEAASRLALHRQRRDIFEVPLDLEMSLRAPFGIMDTVALSHSRFGLAGGRNLRVLGRTLELGARRLVLQLWG